MAEMSEFFGTNTHRAPIFAERRSHYLLTAASIHSTDPVQNLDQTASSFILIILTLLGLMR